MNDTIKIPAGDIRIATRQDTPQNHQENKKKREDHENNDTLNENKVEDLDIDDFMEYGNIVLKKRNDEIKSFLKLHDTNDSNQKHELETLDNLANILLLYNNYFHLVQDENKIINDESIDHLDNIIKKKDDVLSLLENALGNTKFDTFKQFPDNHKNKIKANQVLADIHNIIKEIIKQEDKNSVELHGLKEKMKISLAKQEKGIKAISSYSQVNLKSHFIDKKT